MEQKVKEQAIKTNIETLSDIIGEAKHITNEAKEYLNSGEYNAAIGTILDLEERLEHAKALYQAAIAVHRQKKKKKFPDFLSSLGFPPF